MSIIDYLNSRNEMAKNILANNSGIEVETLVGVGKKGAQLLRDISIALINKNYKEARTVINCSFVMNENLLDVHHDDISCIMTFVARKEMSYKDFVGIAYESLLHENYVLFYAMISLIIYKLNSAQRQFYDDSELKFTLEIIERKLNFPCTFPNTKEDVLLFYEECIDEYYPIGAFLKTKDDYCYKEKSVYDVNTFDMNWVKKDFENCIEKGDMRGFIIDVDNYINTLGNQAKSSEMWNYLTDALMFDFCHTKFQWNTELSKSILMSMVGFSKCYDDTPVMEYSRVMKVHVLSKLIILKKLIELLPTMEKVRCCIEDNLIQMASFLINLYYIFPFSEIVDFLTDIIMPLFDMSVFAKLGSRKENVSEIKKYISLIEKNGKRDVSMFATSVTSSETKITNVEISRQSDYPKVTTVIIGVDMVDSYDIDIEFKFYDNCGQQICNDIPCIESFSEESFEKNHYVYELSILEGSKICRVNAEIVRKGDAFLNPGIGNSDEYDFSLEENINEKTATDNIETDFSNVPEEIENDKEQTDYFEKVFLGILMSASVLVFIYRILNG